MGAAEEPGTPTSWRTVVRRTVAFLLCYWTISLFIVASEVMAAGFLDAGLLYWLSTARILDNPWPLLVALVMIAYVPVRRAVARRRRG